VGGAVTEDTNPYFPLPSKIIPAQPVLDDMPYSVLARQISSSWRWAFPDQIEIMNIMDDIRSYSDLLKREVTRTKGAVYSDGAFAAYSILPLLHRILILSSDSTDDHSQKSDIVRLGCILYFAEIRRLFGIMGIIPSRQTKKLRSLLEKYDNDWGSLEVLKAWVLAMASMESDSTNRDWFFRQLRLSKDRLGIGTWEEMERKFKDILWYDDVHISMFREVLSGVENAPHPGRLRFGGSRFGGYRPIM
jgi:hypothetical protein